MNNPSFAIETRAAELDNFKVKTRIDSVFFSLSQYIKEITIRGIESLLLIFLFTLAIILAQIAPHLFKRHINIIVPALPYIEETETLNWINDVFLLYYYSLKGYRRFCLFRNSINKLLEEVDEHIDSIAYVLENQAKLQNAIETIEQKTA